MGIVGISAVLLICTQIAPDPAFLRDAVVSAERLEYSFLGTQPPLSGKITDKKELAGLAELMAFGARGVEFAPPVDRGPVFVVRVFSNKPDVEADEFILANRGVFTTVHNHGALWF